MPELVRKACRFCDREIFLARMTGGRRCVRTLGRELSGENHACPQGLVWLEGRLSYEAAREIQRRAKIA